MRWLLHVLGVDTQQSYWYDAWSGCIPALLTSTTITATAVAVLRRHTCHEHGCWRPGRHTVEGSPWCDRHHGAARQQAEARVMTGERVV